MNNWQSATRTLQLFNTKAEELFASRFAREVMAMGIAFNLHTAVGTVAEAQVHGPDNEAVKAMAITLRQFVQDNDAISLRNIAKLYEALPLSHDVKRQFSAARTSFNMWLDQSSNFNGFTKRRVFEGILYGDLTHTTQRDLFEEWAGDSLTAPLVQFIFRQCAIEFLKVFTVVRNVNNLAVRELGGTPTTPLLLTAQSAPQESETKMSHRWFGRIVLVLGLLVARVFRMGSDRDTATARVCEQSQQTWSSREDYELYKACMVRVIVKNADGDQACAAAFHIGDGYLVSAAHVFRGHTLVSLDSVYVSKDILVEEMIFPEDKDLDLVVLRTDFSQSRFMGFLNTMDRNRKRPWTDRIPLTGYPHDRFGDELTLSRVLLMGFPRIPLTSDAYLVAVEGHVNAVVRRLSDRNDHFIVSSVPRGGFSGGPVVSEHGYVLGVLTEGLFEKGQVVENGFTDVISLDPLLRLLHKHNIVIAGNEYVIPDDPKWVEKIETELEHGEESLWQDGITSMGTCDERS